MFARFEAPFWVVLSVLITNDYKFSTSAMLYTARLKKTNQGAHVMISNGIQYWPTTENVFGDSGMVNIKFHPPMVSNATQNRRA